MSEANKKSRLKPQTNQELSVLNRNPSAAEHHKLDNNAAGFKRSASIKPIFCQSQIYFNCPSVLLGRERGSANDFPGLPLLLSESFGLI